MVIAGFSGVAVPPKFDKRLRDIALQVWDADIAAISIPDVRKLLVSIRKGGLELAMGPADEKPMCSAEV
ncbi:hypothetical protein HQ544_01290 [Candidatus Falkowbacteria bacterium]|nr:hypothetical protein [Candidatus Falkowbacteria bacterium]